MESGDFGVRVEGGLESGSLASLYRRVMGRGFGGLLVVIDAGLAINIRRFY